MEEVCKNDLVMHVAPKDSKYVVVLEDCHIKGQVTIGRGTDKLEAVQQAYSTLAPMLVALGLQCVTTTQAPFLSCARGLAEWVDGQGLPY